MREQRHPDDTLRWVRRGSALAAIVIGWMFILLMNHFHVTPSVVFACLAYFAVIAAIYTLYRTGATAVAVTNDDDASWGRPIGELSELEREKRTLLRAIKEAEFDHEMGKLSKGDADAMIAVYRARAIEVIKEIDVQNSTSGKPGSVRDRILREARARLLVEQKAEASPAKKKKDKDKQKVRSDKLADAVSAAKKTDAAKVDAKAEAAKVEDAKIEDAKTEAAKIEDAKIEAAKADAKADAAVVEAKTDTPEEADKPAAPVEGVQAADADEPKEAAR
jgi:hypothetical protein